MHLARAESANVEPIDFDFVSLERQFLVILESLANFGLNCT